MRLTTKLDRLGLHRSRRNSSRGRVLILDAPRQDRHEAWRYGQSRWHSANYDDPWPTRG